MKTKQATYAGIGSRKTPSAVLHSMEEMGRDWAAQGWILRSGNCQGADQAFQRGANAVSTRLVELFLPWPGYEADGIALGNIVYTPTSRAYEIAAQYHPAWQKCSTAMQALHARNVQIILGFLLDDPVDNLVCWTPNGVAVGGTAIGIRIAQEHGIPIRNLATTSLNKTKCAQLDFGW
jgi:hypothetical protein